MENADLWKLPPIEKIPEAYGAIADGRVAMKDSSADVVSSDGTKTYRVRWNGDLYSSDDNASKWQGYTGYPIVAVLLLQGRLPLNQDVMTLFKGIPWKELNKKHKNKYAEALAEVLEDIRANGGDPDRVRREMQTVYSALEALKLPRRRGAAKKAERPAPQPFASFPVLPAEPEPLLELCRKAGLSAFSTDSRSVFVNGAVYSFDAFDDDAWEMFLDEYLKPGIRKAGHDVKPLMRRQLDAGKQTGDFVFDTALAAYLLDSLSGCRPLAEVAKLKLNATVPDAVQNPAVIAALVPALTKELEQTGMLHLFETVELPLCEVLVEMEHNGVAADRAMLKDFGVKLSGKIEELRRKVFELAGTEFNINSPKQLGELLFEKLALPSGKKTKSGYSTDIEVLAALRDKHPVVPAVMEFRQLMKLKSTYVDGLLSEIASDGRIHTSFNMMATATGRLSSAEPNLQNIPVRTELGAEIRRMFVAEPGNVLIDADYSQIELRLLAHISGDEVMRNAFRSGFDIHTVTASQVFGVQPDAVTPEMRRRAKAVNFGIVYGISRFALAEDLGVSRKEADDYMNQYFATYSGVRRYMEEIVKTAKKRGYVATIMGRRRYLPELESPVFNIRAFGERVALNAPIQGSSADIIKLAMNNTARRLRAEKRKAKLILQIHDELIIEAPLAEAEPIKTLLREEMENVMRLSVPLTVDVAAGKNWAEAK